MINLANWIILKMIPGALEDQMEMGIVQETPVLGRASSSEGMKQASLSVSEPEPHRL